MSTLVTMLLEATAASGVIFVAIMLFRRVFRRRISPAFRLIIWMVFIVRLAVPVTFETGLHFIPSSMAAAPEGIESPNDAAAGSFVSSVPQEQLTFRNVPNSIVHVISNSTVRYAQASSGLSKTGNGETIPSPAELLTIVWLIGASGFCLLSLKGYRNLRQSISGGKSPDDTLEALFRTCVREIPVKRHVRLVTTKEMTSPALLFPDIILVPASLQQRSSEEIRFAIMHELMHFWRRDHVLLFLVGILRTFYWFNPFVWLAASRIREDIETACDHDVVRNLNDKERAAYAHTVLSFYGQSRTFESVLTMGTSVRSDAERRIRGIYMSSRTDFITKISAIVLIVILAVCCFTTACSPAGITPMADEGTNPSAVPAAFEPLPATIPEEAGDAHEETNSAHNIGPVATGTDMTTKSRPQVAIAHRDTFAMLEVQKAPFSQEMLNEFVTKLAPHVRFEALHGPEEEELNACIADIRTELAECQAEGDLESAAALRKALTDLERELTNARKKDAAVEHGCTFDADGYVAVVGSGPDNEEVMIFAKRAGGDTQNPDFAMFQFWSADFSTEGEDMMYPDEDDARARLELYNNNSISMEEVPQMAADALDTLGISDITVTGVHRALWAPTPVTTEDGMEAEPIPLTRHGVYVEFARMADGLIVSGCGPSLMNENAVLSPFDPEEGAVLLSEDGSIKCLWLNNLMEIGKSVSQTRPILSYNEIRNCLENTIADFLPSGSDTATTYDISEERLVAILIPNPTNSATALTTPVWQFKLTTSNDAGHVCTVDILIDAQTGAAVASGNVETAPITE